MSEYTPIEIKAARALSDRIADQCGIDRDDNWNTYSEDYKADAKVVLDMCAVPDLLEALVSAWLWMENQADGQSKGGHATFDLLMLREQRDIARAAIAKATGEQP